MEDSFAGWRRLLFPAWRLLQYTQAVLTIVIEIPIYYIAVLAVQTFKAFVTAAKKSPQLFRALVLMMKARSAEQLVNDYVREVSVTKRADRRSRRVIKKSHLWNSALHEAGHVVLILKSPHERDLLINSIIWSRAQRNAAMDGYRWGIVRSVRCVPYTMEMALDQLATNYAGVLSVECFLAVARERGLGVSDIRKSFELSSFYASIAAPGPASAACYAWYLRICAWRRARKTLIQERQLVFAIAERLVRKKDSLVSKEEILEIESWVERRCKKVMAHRP